PSRLVSAVPSALTPQGAADFARYFFEVLDAAYNTGDTSTLEAISAPGCKVCDRYISSVKSAYGAGEMFMAGETVVRFAEAPAYTAPVAEVDIVVDFPKVDKRAADGSVAQVAAASKGDRGRMSLTSATGRWQLQEFVLQVP
ncbi:MAG TPA: DUF6318 family protein, partial [Mycobacteriales bacterium]|nr:DUF6318 family protein [Mycobacteriales bacterium]